MVFARCHTQVNMHDDKHANVRAHLRLALLRPGEVTVDDIQRGRDSFNMGDNQNQARLLSLLGYTLGR